MIDVTSYNLYVMNQQLIGERKAIIVLLIVLFLIEIIKVCSNWKENKIRILQLINQAKESSKESK